MDINLFDFNLPEKLIAQKPPKQREMAKLLVMNKVTGELKDEAFFNLVNLLKSGDVLVFNNTKVFPARISFEIEGKKMEILLVESLGNDLWKAMIRPGKRFKIGTRIELFGQQVQVIGEDSDGLRILKFNLNNIDFTEFLKLHGRLPVPPYITGTDYQEDEYNTVFSAKEKSIAAPTAGLHFNDELLARLQAKGVILEFVTLEVGRGTFLPVKTGDSRLHKMHSENYEISFETAKGINGYKQEGKRIIAVGTTTVRVLEDNFSRFGQLKAGKFSTDIFIKPGYDWKIVEGLITNFHLPKSTLLMLVSAFAKRETILKAYEYATRRGYLFFSFGDAMLII